MAFFNFKLTTFIEIVSCFLVIRFVIGSAFSHAINIVLLVLVSVDERKKLPKSLPIEKNIGSVLLY